MDVESLSGRLTPPASAISIFERSMGRAMDERNQSSLISDEVLSVARR
ncbi:hypothetical protein GGE12_001871 [Rhizobium mongolense]|uniref:Uncharacterized protein n=1 Tax=Rhizobium mongolense TaxID=57676 RepID=A0A7W6WDI0_9HYPH|nr:hypothetical protein [Rhizobium mongolense]